LIIYARLPDQAPSCAKAYSPVTQLLRNPPPRFLQ
jgi:hypothetical protein